MVYISIQIDNITIFVIFCGFMFGSVFFIVFVILCVLLYGCKRLQQTARRETWASPWGRCSSASSESQWSTPIDEIWIRWINSSHTSRSDSHYVLLWNFQLPLCTCRTLPDIQFSRADIDMGDQICHLMVNPLHFSQALYRQLPVWWIHAPEDFVTKTDRVLECFGPAEFANQQIWQVKVMEKPVDQLWCMECCKPDGICRSKSTHTDWRLCPICERHRCDHGEKCTRKNLGCKWCHFDPDSDHPENRECFFNKKDYRKFMRSINRG